MSKKDVPGSLQCSVYKKRSPSSRATILPGLPKLDKRAEEGLKAQLEMRGEPSLRGHLSIFMIDKARLGV